MIDHLLGRPSISWRRTQVILVIIFWFWRVLRGDPSGPSLLWIRRANRALNHCQHPYWVYAVRNLDKILGLAAPEPLANLYSPSYYRATWVTTGLDAGFATAMHIRPQWLKDICSILFSIYYIIYAHEADEKLRKYRAAPTVEMLRTTWEKTTNPYIRMVTLHPRISIRRKILLARPKDSTQRRPITTWLFFAPPADQLASATDLILDFPGEEHHEERLRMWAIRSGKPVLSVDYGKAPEYPYPYSIDECFDLYRVLVETTGMVIGMSGHALNIILTGDSAGAHIAVTVMFKILQTQMNLPHPLALVLNYAALDFNFTSWMTPQNLRVLQTEQSSGHLSLLPDQKDHLGHISPLSMVGDRRPRRRRSLRDTLRQFTSSSAKAMPPLRTRHTTSDVRRMSYEEFSQDEGGAMGDVEDESPSSSRDDEKPLRARIRFNPQVDVKREVESPVSMDDAAPSTEATAPIGTRLTMTSRTGYFQDRIISPSMMRAMAILYIGPHRNPDFQSDYQLSPILAPDHLLAQFPPLLMTCGEKDPFVDDTLIFAGRVREAKRARRAELERIIARTSPSIGVHDPSVHGDLRALQREYERLAAETEEDWVRMVIFSEWSHGYLQMPSLIREVRGVIDDLADWMGEVFARPDGAPGSMFADARDAGNPPADLRGASHPALASPRTRRLSKVQANWSNSGSRDTDTDGFASTTSETELDTDDGLTFAPKRRSPPSSYADMRRNSTASNATVRRASASHGRTASQSSKAPSPPTATPNGVSGDLRSDILYEVPTPIREVEALRQFSPTKRPSSSSPGNGSAPTPSKALQGGQTITESELMRRRRLLDSHLISQTQDSVK
ncbi:Alpha/Beta hydrolase protein [Cerioporus squamosus]|nr:Alpha/Beta hydrolase protein [Cerioporus squamosus]